MKLQIKSLQTLKIIIVGLAIIFTAGLVHAEQSKITQEEVIKTQKTWGDALVNLGKTYTDGGDYEKVAKNLVNTLYAYQTGQVLFKPTKASDDKFRETKEGAISYFVGHNKNFPEDKGFALKPWTNVRFQNAGISINDDVALAMGKYFFTPLKGEAVKVEYTFGYVKKGDGSLKIILHHSSLPYDPK
jgi:hypothetical protein